MTKLAAILDQIASGSVLLPEFQRGYVWNCGQVRGFMRSLYLGYPMGGLLTWETQSDSSLIRRDAAASRPASTHPRRPAARHVLDPEDADLPKLKELGYEFFVSADSLRGYVRRRNLEAAGPTL